MSTIVKRFNWHSDDGTVDAWLEYPDAEVCDIIELRATPPGQGHGTRALRLLRQRFRRINAITIGDETHPNRNFWTRAGKAGLIDYVCDIEGRMVWPRS